MKFRKKPVVIEAHQWWPPEHPKFFGRLDGVTYAPRSRMEDCETIGYIDTLEGRLHVSPGDWVIRGVAGEFYPCKPAIFEATYERVDE